MVARRRRVARRHPVGAEPARGTRPPAQKDRALDHGVGADLREVADPAVERLTEHVGIARQLLVPDRRMRDRIPRGPVQEPGVALGPLEPVARARRPVLALDDPRDEQVGESAFFEVPGGLADQVLAEPVRVGAAVPERVPGVRRDDIGRVAQDEVEALAGDGIEQASLAELDVRHLVQTGVERGEVERPRVHVDRHDALAVAGGPDRLNARARPDVEGGSRRRPDGQAAQDRGRGGDRRDIVGRTTGRALVRVAVPCEEKLGLGHDADGRLHGAARGLGNAQLFELVDPERRHRPLERSALDRFAEKEEADRGLERGRGRQAAQVDGHVARTALVGVIAEELPDRIARVSDRAKRIAQTIDGLRPFERDRAGRSRAPRAAPLPRRDSTACQAFACSLESIGRASCGRKASVTSGRGTMAAVDYFLKIEGIDGESAHAKHKGEIDVESWSWGETHPASPAAGAGVGAGKVTMNDFTFTMKLSKASPKLFLACAQGEHIKSAWMTAHRAGGKDQGYFLKWSFGDLLVSGYHAGASAGEAPLDSVSFAFSKLEVEYKEQKADGTLAASIRAGWDVKANKKF